MRGNKFRSRQRSAKFTVPTQSQSLDNRTAATTAAMMTLQTCSLSSKGIINKTSISQNASQFNFNPTSNTKQQKQAKLQKGSEMQTKLTKMNVTNFMVPSQGVAIGVAPTMGSRGATRQSESATSKNFLQARIFARNLGINTLGQCTRVDTSGQQRNYGLKSNSGRRNLGLEQAKYTQPHSILQHLSFDHNSSYGLSTCLKKQVSKVRLNQDILVPNQHHVVDMSLMVTSTVKKSMATLIAGQSSMQDIMCSPNGTLSPRSQDGRRLGSTGALHGITHTQTRESVRLNTQKEKIRDETDKTALAECMNMTPKSRQDVAKSQVTGMKGNKLAMTQTFNEEVKSPCIRLSEPLMPAQMIVRETENSDGISENKQIQINVTKLIMSGGSETDSPLLRCRQPKSSKINKQRKSTLATQQSVQSRRTTSAHNGNLSARGEQEFSQLNARYSHDLGIVKQTKSTSPDEQRIVCENTPSRNLECIVEQKVEQKSLCPGSDGSPRMKLQSRYIGQRLENKDDNFSPVQKKNNMLDDSPGMSKALDFKLQLSELKLQAKPQTIACRSTRVDIGNLEENTDGQALANIDGNINISSILEHAQRNELFQNVPQNAYCGTFDRSQEGNNDLMMVSQFNQPRLSHPVASTIGTSSESIMVPKRNSVGPINFQEPVNKLVSDVAQAIGESVRRMQPRSLQRNLKSGVSRREKKQDLSQYTSLTNRRTAKTSQAARSRGRRVQLNQKGSASSKNTLLNRIARITMASQSQIAKNDELKEKLEGLGREQTFEQRDDNATPISFKGAMSQTCILPQPASLIDSRLQSRIRIGGRPEPSLHQSRASSITISSRNRKTRFASPSQTLLLNQKSAMNEVSPAQDGNSKLTKVQSQNDYSIQFNQKETHSQASLQKIARQKKAHNEFTIDFPLQVSRKPIVKVQTQPRNSLKNRAQSNSSNSPSSPYGRGGQVEKVHFIDMPSVSKPSKVITFQIPKRRASCEKLCQSPTIMKNRDTMQQNEQQQPTVKKAEPQLMQSLNLIPQETFPATVYNDMDLNVAAQLSYGHTSISYQTKPGDIAIHQNNINYQSSGSPDPSVHKVPSHPQVSNINFPILQDNLMAPVYANQDLLQAQENLIANSMLSEYTLSTLPASPKVPQQPLSYAVQKPRPPSFARKSATPPPDFYQDKQQNDLSRGFEGLLIQGQRQNQIPNCDMSNANLASVSKYAHTKPNRWLREAILRGNRQRKDARGKAQLQKKPAGGVSIDIRSPRREAKVQQTASMLALQKINHNRHCEEQEGAPLSQAQTKLGVHLMTANSTLVVETQSTQRNLKTKDFASAMTTTSRKTKDEAALSSRGSVNDILTISRMAPEHAKTMMANLPNDIVITNIPTSTIAINAVNQEEEAIIQEIKQMQDDYRSQVGPARMPSKSTSNAVKKKATGKVQRGISRPISSILTKRGTNKDEKRNESSQVEFMVLPSRVLAMDSEYTKSQPGLHHQNTMPRMEPSQGQIFRKTTSRGSSVTGLSQRSQSPIIHQKRQSLVSLALLQQKNVKNTSRKQKNLLNALRVEGEKVTLAKSIDAAVFVASASARHSKMVDMVRSFEKIYAKPSEIQQQRANSAVTTEKIRVMTNESLAGAQAMSPDQIQGTSFDQMHSRGQTKQPSRNELTLAVGENKKTEQNDLLLGPQPHQFQSQSSQHKQNESVGFYSLYKK